jgi:hypothetical protein
MTLWGMSDKEPVYDGEPLIELAIAIMLTLAIVLLGSSAFVADDNYTRPSIEATE